MSVKHFLVVLLVMQFAALSGLGVESYQRSVVYPTPQIVSCRGGFTVANINIPEHCDPTDSRLILRRRKSFA